MKLCDNCLDPKLCQTMQACWWPEKDQLPAVDTLAKTILLLREAREELRRDNDKSGG